MENSLTKEREIQDVEELSADLKRLLVRHESTLKEEGVRDEVVTLERWMEAYREGLSAADKISQTGMDRLCDLRNHLKLAIEEMQRLEGEGGNPASREQSEKLEDLLKAVRRIDGVIPDLEQMFARAPVKTPEPA